MRSIATRCKIAKMRLKIRRGQLRGSSPPLPAPEDSGAGRSRSTGLLQSVSNDLMTDSIESRIGLSDVSTSLWSWTAGQLKERVGSTDPTPGGGSVSIVAATLAIASIQKGIVVSLKRSAADFARHVALLDARTRASALIASLSELADADSYAFERYLEACALPRGTEQENALRRAARETGLVQATQVPLEAAVEMRRGLEFAEAAAELVDAHVRSEVLVGEILLRASIRAVLLSVDANITGIADTAVRDTFKLQRDKLELA
jgi:methenyltetrahydrofolate cyclohydrolase